MPYTWTQEQAIAARPCSHYGRARIAGLWAGREALTPADIAALDIPPADRVWALLRMAPRELWLPAIFAAADRAVRQYTPERLRRIGRHAEAERLAALPRLESAEQCRAAAAHAASAYAADAAHAASAYAAAAAHAASASAFVAVAAAAYAAAAADDADAAERAQQISDLVACLEGRYHA